MIASQEIYLEVSTSLSFFILVDQTLYSQNCKKCSLALQKSCNVPHAERAKLFIMCHIKILFVQESQNLFMFSNCLNVFCI